MVKCLDLGRPRGSPSLTGSADIGTHELHRTESADHLVGEGIIPHGIIVEVVGCTVRTSVDIIILYNPVRDTIFLEDFDEGVGDPLAIDPQIENLTPVTGPE